MRFSQNSSSNSNSLLKNNKFSSQLAQKKEWNPFVCVIKAFHSVQLSSCDADGRLGKSYS